MEKNNSLKSRLEKSIGLSHLEIPAKEKDALLVELEKILHFVGIIEKAGEEGDEKFKGKLSELEQEFPQMKKTGTMRADKSIEFDNKVGLQKEIPSKKESLIRVKKI